MEIVDVEDRSNEVEKKLKGYDIDAVPSVVVDGKIKVVGIRMFPWFCGDEFYRFLETEYPLLKKIEN